MNYNKYTLKQLKFKLKIYGEKLSGKKYDLIERLNFVNNPIISTLDTDRLIYLYLDDSSLFNMFMVNSYVNDVICDDLFWCYRLKKMFGENSTDSSMRGSHKEIYRYLRHSSNKFLINRICERGYCNMLKSVIDEFQINVRLKLANSYEIDIMRNILMDKYNNELMISIFTAVMKGYIDILRILVKRIINITDIPSFFQLAPINIKYKGNDENKYQEIKKYCEERIPFIIVDK